MPVPVEWDPQANKFQQISSLSHQMSLVGSQAGKQYRGWGEAKALYKSGGYSSRVMVARNPPLPHPLHEQKDWKTHTTESITNTEIIVAATLSFARLCEAVIESYPCTGDSVKFV